MQNILYMPDISPNEFPATLTNLVLGASESIDLIIGREIDFGLFDSKLIDTDIIALADSRLRLRCILQEKLISKNHLKILKENGWETRQIQSILISNYLIIDKRHLLMWYSKNEYEPKPVCFYKDILLDSDISAAQMAFSQFESLWSEEGIEVLYEDILYSFVPAERNKIISVSEDTWSDLIKALNKNPEELYLLTPRKFEELVAELLTRKKMKVKLTKKTRDGGYDMLALSETEIGQHLYYVECKRHSKGKPVDVTIVRALYGVVENDKATAGLIVTTSYFTKDADSFREDVKYRMSFKDYNDLKDWIKTASD